MSLILAALLLSWASSEHYHEIRSGIHCPQPPQSSGEIHPQWSLNLVLIHAPFCTD